MREDSGFRRVDLPGKGQGLVARYGRKLNYFFCLFINCVIVFFFGSFFIKLEKSYL